MVRGLTAALACGVCIVAIATPAQAQTRQYRIPAGSLKSALDAYARQSGRQVIYKVEDIRQARSRGTSGNISAEAALAAILSGTGFRAQRDSSGALAIIPANAAAGPSATAAGPSTPQVTATSQTADDDAEGVPEILVNGRRDWSLNTGIERTRDDTQPFVVFDQEDIKRSGSTNTEQFFRDYLNANTSEITSEQNFGNATESRGQGVGGIDLRGLGTRETLILIDGRRQAGLNRNSGIIEQPLLSNIPLAAIERIEVLASSAAGVYGAGATGGVINIILRRDYSGRQLSLNYADTTDLRAPDRRIDLVLGQSLEEGRSNISLTASYRQSDPLRNRDRRNIIEAARRTAFTNNPGIDAPGGLFGNPPVGATSNIRSVNRQPLRLDPIYGGTLLSSNRTFVPVGFRGIATDGIAPLLANVGQYNLDLADRSAAFAGGGTPIIFGVDLLSGTLALRREMTSWLRVYAEAAASRSLSKNVVSLAPFNINLPANAPNNPFQQAIIVQVPFVGAQEERTSRNSQLRFVGGAIAQLGGGWQAILDAKYDENRYQGPKAERTITQASRANLTNGTFDIIQDASLAFPFEYLEFQSPNTTFSSNNVLTALKLAGPVPIRLPGGNPSLVLNVDRNHTKFSDSVQASDSGLGLFSVTYTPARSQTFTSVYGELRLPLVGRDNDIPFVEAFEVAVAARYEHYKGRGAGINIPCFSGNSTVTEDEAILALCDPSKLTISQETASNSHIDPTFSAKWTVSRDLALRGSYATGYLPPSLNQLVKVATTNIFIIGTDPLRGGEAIGIPAPFFPGATTVPGFIGGNPDVRPETSKSLSVGAILTPRFIPGLRFSADYTKIDKRDNYGSPQGLLLGAIDTFLELFPERVTRGPASGGFSVGPITSIDASVINIAGSGAEAIDFALDYSRPLWGGTIDFTSTATRALSLKTQITSVTPVVDQIGVLPVGRTGPSLVASGAIEWKGNASIRWSNDVGSIGVRARYFDGYFLNQDRSVDITTGSATIPSQTYIDVFSSFEPWKNLTINAGVNNVFNKVPPFVQNSYSPFGDPRLANFYINLTANF